jgi:hypothetical protein
MIGLADVHGEEVLLYSSYTLYTTANWNELFKIDGFCMKRFVNWVVSRPLPILLFHHPEIY